MAKCANQSTGTEKSYSKEIRLRVKSKFVLIWLDTSLNQTDNKHQHILEHFARTIDKVHTFIQVDECIDFVTDLENQQVLLIIQNALAQHLIDHIHSLPQLHSIYIFCNDEALSKEWTEKWFKIIKVSTEIEPICDALKMEVAKDYRDSVPLSFAPLEENNGTVDLNRLEPSFMYTKLLKRALLEMEHGNRSRQHLLNCWRHQYAENAAQLKLIDEYELDDRPYAAIWWYTRECFAYEMLNQALRLLEGSIVADMGIFICALHQQIERLHRKQYSQYNGKTFVVYRGQGLSTSDFEKLKKAQGGLVSFNSFISTSCDRGVSLLFAESSIQKPGTIGILYVMTIDPNMPSTPFANIQSFSYFAQEGEILFSMHTIFRIGQIEYLGNQDRLVEVHLTLTADDDPHLRKLTDRLETELQEFKGWERVGILLRAVGRYEKAEEIYLELLRSTVDQRDEAFYNHHLGLIKGDQGDYEEAIRYYERAIDIRHRYSEDQIRFAQSYNNIGLVYYLKGDYSKALFFYEKTLAIRETALPEHHPDLATIYSNIGSLYTSTGDNGKALLFSERALNIYRVVLPENHFALTISYNNIACVHLNMKEYSRALVFYEKSVDIQEKILPKYHPDLATSYNNLGLLYTNMGLYSKALLLYNRACEIFEQSLSVNHPSIAACYHNIGLVHFYTNEYSKALVSYEKSIEIKQKSLPGYHSDLATSYDAVGSVYLKMEQYSKALSFYEKACEVVQKALPINYCNLVDYYNNIAKVYYEAGQHLRAVSIYEKVLDIRQKSLPVDDNSLASTYRNIGVVYDVMREYSTAALYYQNALDIKERILPAHHPDFSKLYSDLGAVYDNMEEYSRALTFYEKALDLYQTVLPTDQLGLATTCTSIASVYTSKHEYSKALSFHERALAIYQENPPQDELTLATSYADIGLVYFQMENYPKAIIFLEQAKSIGQRSLPSDHPDVKNTDEIIALARNHL